MFDAARFGGGPGVAHGPDAHPLDPRTLAVLACTGRLRRVLTAPTGAVLDLGRSTRLATPAQRTALSVRDAGCVIPGCPVPARHCDAHHLTSWADGGPTDLDNLILACPRHHGEIHDGTWTITIINRLPWVTPPPWIHPHHRLLRNTTHHNAA